MAGALQGANRGGPGGSGSRDRPAAASRRSTAWAAASGPFPGARMCSCPNTSAPAASSNTGHRQQRTQRKSHVPLYPARGVRTVVAVPRRPRRICAFAPPAGSNNPTRHVENCGRPARGLDSTGARSTITAGCMTAVDGKRGHRNSARTGPTARRGTKRPGAARQGRSGRCAGESLPPVSPPPCFTIHGDPDARYPHIAP